MSADARIMEALCRIEFKVDIALELICKLAGITELPKLGEPFPCLICKQVTVYEVDIENSVVVRKCGCATGKIALDLKSFAPPTPAKKENSNDTGSDQEDWRDPDRRGRTGRR